MSGVEGHLLMVPHGSQNRDYDGTFAVREQHGPLTISNVPIDVIENVLGDVLIESTTEMVSSSIHHADGMRTLSTPAARHCAISQVTGNLTAHFTRASLGVSDITGVVNIQNDFGDTHWTIAAPLVAANHRVVTHSGLLSVQVARSTIVNQPLFVATSCGTAATNLARDELDDISVTGTSESDGLRRDWRAFHSRIPQDDFMTRFELYGRPDSILHDGERTHGVDLVSAWELSRNRFKS